MSNSNKAIPSFQQGPILTLLTGACAIYIAILQLGRGPNGSFLLSEDQLYIQDYSPDGVRTLIATKSHPGVGNCS